MTTVNRTQEETQQILALVHERFSVEQEFLRDGGAIEFLLQRTQRETKSSFASLIRELKKNGDTAILRIFEDQTLRLLVFPKPPPGRPRLKLPLALFIATIVTVALDGYIRAVGYTDPITKSLPMSEVATITIIYAVSLMGIIGIHELGHKIASWHHGMNSSWPYFIPFIPGIWPTMGAVITTADPPVNRDSLFDLGISGPIAGLIVTVVVSIAAVASAVVLPFTPSSGTPGQYGVPDYYTSFLLGVLKPASSSNLVAGPLFGLLYFAYSFGFLLTFINLLPAWQLDGGHVANSALSARTHRILTFVSVAVMVLIGFYFMALLVLLFSTRAQSLRPLDDVSPLSRGRRVGFILAMVLCAAIYILEMYNNLAIPMPQTLTQLFG